MKTKIYLRVAKGGRNGYRAEASAVPNYDPIKKQSAYNSHYEFLPTVAFAVEFDIPDEMFKQSERVIASVNVAMKDAKITGEMLVPMIKEFKLNEKSAKKGN